MSHRVAALVSATMLAFAPVAGFAQNYRVRVDASAQAVSFRGLAADSIVANLVVPGANGGLQTPEGYSVRCGAGGYCYFLRPGLAMRGMPVSTSASVVLWGLGVEGMSFHATGRLVADAGHDRVWPGTTPTMQLLEG
ncbi:MAG: hypothetical protein ABMA00_02475, partial [Gemmatimonas sp.]